MKIRNIQTLKQLKTQQSIKLSTFIQDIHQTGKHINISESNNLKSSTRSGLKKWEQKKQLNHIYQSYQMEKKAIQQGLLTPQHLNKYLKPKKRHKFLQKKLSFKLVFKNQELPISFQMHKKINKPNMRLFKKLQNVKKIRKMILNSQKK
ncbi:unnamed protein product [Paramecium sonneborni]|uniref:Uncharacterized protein n=1 Tax=Paramecium sonneborni TaxID=65129 RepID=A0A8S1KHB3_9CILI|nr:unnamed protein product [Paramecium sonneborni]